MNIMHNKTEKFTTQLRHATLGERRWCHWSTASSIVVAETRESVVG